MNQTTIQRPVACSGIGLHSGKHVSLEVRPAPANTGIVFHLQTAKGVHRITPTPSAVMTTALATTLGNSQSSVSTVEHLLASVRGLGVDNLIIAVEGGEIPILDGSAAEFIELFDRAGIRQQTAFRRVLRVARHMILREGNKCIEAWPSNRFHVDYTIDFPHPSIGRQHWDMDVTPATFTRVASARTFGFLKDVEYLHNNGLALGGSLDNVVVLDDAKVMNEEGLRYTDEFVRHKVLDFIGDMAMLPLPLQGDFSISCSGHQLNNIFLRMLANQNALHMLELPHRETRHLNPMQTPAYEGSLALA